jgi:cell division protein FtsZ
VTIDLDTNNQTSNRICVIGIGGAGGNAVNNMIKRGINGVDFITANTDKKALDKTSANEKILLGEELTKGGGAGAKPEVGKQSAEESAEQIKSAVEGYELAFVTCGMGGGTGTGGSPVIARLIKEANPQTVVVGIVCKCFNREGTNKKILAEEGIANLKANVDAIIVVPNDKILEVCSGCSPFEAYSKANDILYNAVRGIVDIIEIDSFMNVEISEGFHSPNPFARVTSQLPLFAFIKSSRSRSE